MRMSLKQIVILLGLILLLAACKPSDKYKGEWYAVSDDGEKVTAYFSEEKELTIKDENNREEKHKFNQTETGFINEVGYYGIQMEDENYYVVFHNKKDKANAKLVKQTNQASDFEDVVGDIVLKMNRDDYPTE